MPEIYTSEDKNVIKIVHDNGAETAVKYLSSCEDQHKNINKDNFKPVLVDGNKYTVFVSSSVGCPYKCKFCFLNIKKFPYYKLTDNEIFENVKEAIIEACKIRPDFKKKYLKLSWMGMGDAFTLPRSHLFWTNERILSWAIINKYAKGVDAIDISTVNLINASSKMKEMMALNVEMQKYISNPITENSQSLFLSLHSGFDNIRRALIGVTQNLHYQLEMLQMFKLMRYNVVFHHILFNGINDTNKELDRLISICSEMKIELRLLRYNKCEKSPFIESKRFDEFVKILSRDIPYFKYQLSPGSEIQAACGMFVCKRK